MPIHVVHITSGHEYSDPRILRKQCASLAEFGFRVTLVARTPVDENISLPNGVELVTVPRPKGRFNRFTQTSRAVVRAAKALQPDIIHFHDPDLLPHCVSLAWGGKQTVVYDVHEDYRASVADRSWIPKPVAAIAKRAVEVLEGKMAAKGFIVAATPDIAANFPADRTVTVQNFPRLQEFSENDPAPSYNTRANRIAYVGSISQERGVDAIIDALPVIAKSIPDITFDLVGPASENFLDAARKRAGWAHTRYHGKLDRPQVVAVLNQAKAGLVTLLDVPRYRVSQPTKLYEYMASGIPFVASDFPLWRELTENCDVGEYVVPNSDAIAAGVIKLLSDPNAAEEKGRIAKDLVHRLYSWDNEAERLLALYRTALELDRVSKR